LFFFVGLPHTKKVTPFKQNPFFLFVCFFFYESTIESVGMEFAIANIIDAQ